MIMDKNTCKKLDQILETLNKQITRGLDVLKFCKENFEFENLNHEMKLEAVQEFRFLISKLIDIL